MAASTSSRGGGKKVLRKTFLKTAKTSLLQMREQVLEGIEHDASPAQHMVHLTLAKTFASFLLDSSTFGVLDTNALGF